MEEHVDEGGMTPGGRMGKAIIKGIMIGFPAGIIGLSVAVWLITDLDLAESVITAILPGVLLGGFAGGFAGLAATMD